MSPLRLNHIAPNLILEKATTQKSSAGMRDGFQGAAPEDLDAELPATNAKTKLQNDSSKNVRPASWDGGNLYADFYFFFARDRMCATTALTSSSDSFALNEGMDFPFPFFIVSAI